MGFTVPEIDKILEPYAQKTYDKVYAKTMALLENYNEALENNKLLTIIGKALRKIATPIVEKIAEVEAMNAVQTEMRQGFQGLEYKFNTVGSSRGDYPFITFTAGLATSKFGKMASITMFDVRRKGQGKKDRKKPVLFPKRLGLMLVTA